MRTRRAVRGGVKRYAAKAAAIGVGEPRDVGDDRREKAVEAARAGYIRQSLKDQRVAQHKRSLRNARETYRRLLESHLVSVHGSTLVKDPIGGHSVQRPDGSRGWDLDEEHEVLHGRQERS
jgi:hypothetical protein